MPFGRVLGVGKLLLLVGGLVATFLVFAAIAMRVAVRALEIRVPELAGKPLDEARALATETGLTVRVDEGGRPDPRVPAGHVLGQDLPPGSMARRQRSIRLWISSGPRVVVAPKLIGESERAAQIRLTQEGVTTASIAEIRDADYPPGVVVAQDPPPDTRTSEVRLLVNRGTDRASYVMPDLIGVNGDRAADFLRSKGFRVSLRSQQPAPDIPPGVVIRQTPAGGYQVHPGDSITLEISQ
ncbi:MAG: PASTA domain-containing protein [Acidobacteria bacterium]|nr:PASTA domain-containing protein [Acidobacteriota bacterium]